MTTESLGFAKFDHPRHGSFVDPADVLNSDRLSAGEKEEVLREWQTSLKQSFGKESGGSAAQRQHETLDEAIERLAGGCT
ncbi:hypothetical protein [Consotaella aegiceratis]|uniref:hypothetical protein n=1 Tax=Consotaella aegiceratis TaxID=3097961 RepID=UPI002F3E682D